MPTPGSNQGTAKPRRRGAYAYFARVHPSIASIRPNQRPQCRIRQQSSCLVSTVRNRQTCARSCLPHADFSLPHTWEYEFLAIPTTHAACPHSRIPCCSNRSDDCRPCNRCADKYTTSPGRNPLRTPWHVQSRTNPEELHQTMPSHLGATWCFSSGRRLFLR